MTLLFSAVLYYVYVVLINKTNKFCEISTATRQTCRRYIASYMQQAIIISKYIS